MVHSFIIQVSDQLCAKYSKEYGKLCRTNQIGTVNDRVRELGLVLCFFLFIFFMSVVVVKWTLSISSLDFLLKLMHKLSVEAPPKILVERYLIEIAKNYNVPYEPDAMVRVRTSFFSLYSVEGLGCRFAKIYFLKSTSSSLDITNTLTFFKIYMAR